MRRIEITMHFEETLFKMAGTFYPKKREIEKASIFLISHHSMIPQQINISEHQKAVSKTSMIVFYNKRQPSCHIDKHRRRVSGLIIEEIVIGTPKSKINNEDLMNQTLQLLKMHELDRYDKCCSAPKTPVKNTANICEVLNNKIASCSNQRAYSRRKLNRRRHQNWSLLCSGSKMRYGCCRIVS